ncbi:MAG: glycoside hydrolase family 2 barrel [Gemmatimonadetes bacterium]|nr:glycoside hydrolase family 2 barrel [Gemmatimonadota bacterium]
MLSAFSVAGAQRVEYTINAGWRYHADGLNLAEKPATPDETWERVSIPHTWNATDPFDDRPSYRRGVGWYRNHLAIPESMRGKRLSLHFEGVNQVADVFVNNAFAGRHSGGYTAFTIDITRLVKIGANADNVVAVQVDNSHNPYIAPLSVGFALYGGIYRDVWLVATDDVHFAMNDHGATGVTVTTPTVSRERATTVVRGIITNDGGSARNIDVVSTLTNAAGQKVSERRSSVSAPAGSDVTWEQALPDVAPPHLWSPNDPYLYALTTEVVEGAMVRDHIVTPVGYRWFSFNAATGFSLNGSHLQLRGTNRHQDYAGLGSALSNDLHRKDMEIIKDMGANFVRLAHYPQDPAVLDAADKLGLLIWEEIPVVNYITPSPEFTRNSENMLIEMIRQHRNHPSVIVWGTENEVFLWGPGAYRIGKQNDTVYMRQVRDYTAHMDSLARREDPSRVSTLTMHGSDDYDASGVAAIGQMLGLNLYNGWYNGTFAEFGSILDRRHAKTSDRVLFVSEYGAEDDYRVNSLEPERFDFSSTWMRRYHESYLAQINARPWLGGTAIWNEFDFSQPETGGTIPYMNQKGMLTFDRKPKDVYYLYKANWNPAPMVYIASRGWTKRIGTSFLQPVDVYSNLARVELFINGKSLGAKAPDSVKRATWDVPFVNGDNVIEARAGSVTDRLVVQFIHRPAMLADASVPFTELGVNVGTKAQVADESNIWIGDQAYTPGGFGYVGGTAAMFDKDLAITNSAETPLYFTYRVGLSAYKLDVPDGEYDVELLFAEPVARPGERVFGVAVNDHVLAERLDLSAAHGIARAATYTSHVQARGGAGITVRFTPVQGQPILNAIHVRKN